VSTQAAIGDGMVVSMHYTLRDDDGEVLDTSRDGEPFAYLHGAGNIVPGLERELAGKGIGDVVEAVVPPEDGYGERSGPEPQPVPRDRFPADADLEEGVQVYARGPAGEAFALWVAGVDGDQILLDHNHPLAGVTLHFAVEITAIREATSEEIEHQHPHGPEGHAH
jgi:FKBP-type peptidyl-prolyl cis-trans isomerase SlyD